MKNLSRSLARRWKPGRSYNEFAEKNKVWLQEKFNIAELPESLLNSPSITSAELPIHGEGLSSDSLSLAQDQSANEQYIF